MQTEMWMKTGMIIAVLSACTLVTANAASADDATVTESGQVEKGKKGSAKGQNRKAAMEKYDKDGDGKLSDAEHQTMKADRAAAREKEAMEGASEGERPSREEMVKKFDKDGDGQLSEDERAAARAARGSRGGAERPNREEMIKQFDKDGDGQLSEDERAAARAARGSRGGSERPSREEMVKQYDKDGDGQLNDEERAEARKAMQQKRKEQESSATE